MAIIRVFEQYQTAVAGDPAFSGKIKVIVKITVKADSFICPLETVPHSLAEGAALVFVTYDVPDGFPGVG